MKCVAYVERAYSEPGQCANPNGVRFVRWAPTPLKTKLYKGLCSPHRRILETRGTVKTIHDK